MRFSRPFGVLPRNLVDLQFVRRYGVLRGFILRKRRDFFVPLFSSVSDCNSFAGLGGDKTCKNHHQLSKIIVQWRVLRHCTEKYMKRVFLDKRLEYQFLSLSTSTLFVRDDVSTRIALVFVRSK